MIGPAVILLAVEIRRRTALASLQWFLDGLERAK